jgi:3-carboxy-cis,cis-muconate cycloisomerase
MAGLFDGVLAAGPVAERVSDLAWLQAMLDAEAALAGAQADVGLISASAAAEIAAACDASRFSVSGIGTAAVSVGNPAAPLVRELTAAVSPEAAKYVHFGATSQDIVDTAAMLVTRRALAVLDVESVTESLAALAETHRDTVTVGRTLLQHALPTTFGLVAAGWLTGLSTAGDALAAFEPAVQLGGAVGTLASLGPAGPAVAEAMARRLDLATPVLPWHTDRDRVRSLASALGRVCGAVGKIAGDVVLLAQTEVGEVAEAASGGSSTMPHKQNPVAAVAARAAAAQAPGLVATLLSATHEHQRAAGAWHAEWRPLTELLRSTGSAVHQLAASLTGLVVHTDRMRSNVDLLGGALLAERVTTSLTPSMGRQAAHDAVADAVRTGDLASLVDSPDLLDPAGYLGSAGEFVDRAVAAYRKEGR